MVSRQLPGLKPRQQRSSFAFFDSPAVAFHDTPSLGNGPCFALGDRDAAASSVRLAAHGRERDASELSTLPTRAGIRSCSQTASCTTRRAHSAGRADPTAACRRASCRTSTRLRYHTSFFFGAFGACASADPAKASNVATDSDVTTAVKRVSAWSSPGGALHRRFARGNAHPRRRSARRRCDAMQNPASDRARECREALVRCDASAPLRPRSARCCGRALI